MATENIDLESLIHQELQALIPVWESAGLSQDEYQDAASQFHQMGLIAINEIQKTGGILVQGTDQKIEYSQEVAQKTARYFLRGMSPALLKSHEHKIPRNEQWQLLQSVAFHVFQTAQQAVMATVGQEDTPEIQISMEQIDDWLEQTAVEALMYYLNEYEKEHGPIAVTEEVGAELLQEAADEQLEEEPAVEEEPAPEVEQDIPQEAPPVEEPAPVAVATGVPEVHHKYAAIALLLNTMSSRRQAGILSAFQPDEVAVIEQYRNPEVIATTLDLSLVANYLRSFKEKMGQSRDAGKSQYATTMKTVLQSLPKERLTRLFQKERPLVRGYVQQYLQQDDRGMMPYQLPEEVEESLLMYLHRNFPEQVKV